MSLSRLFNQERVPVFTGISLCTSAAVETFIVRLATAPAGSGTNGIGGVVAGGFLVVAGAVINVVAGTIANWRHEYWGGRIAACGTAAWFVTIAVLLFR